MSEVNFPLLTTWGQQLTVTPLLLMEVEKPNNLHKKNIQQFV